MKFKIMSERGRVVVGLVAEVIFAVLPLLALLFVLIYTTHLPRLFAYPEWSFGAAILFGQALVKFVSGLARAGSAAQGPVALAVAVLVVFGLLPSLLLLTMILQSLETPTGAPALWLRIGQVSLFCAAAATYILLGTVGEEWGRSR